MRALVLSILIVLGTVGCSHVYEKPPAKCSGVFEPIPAE